MIYAHIVCTVHTWMMLYCKYPTDIVKEYISVRIKGKKGVKTPQHKIVELQQLVD